MSTDTQPLPIVRPLDEESPEAPKLDYDYTQIDSSEEPDVALIRLGVGFRPFVIVVTNEDETHDGQVVVEEIVSSGYDRDEAIAVLTSGIEALYTAS